MNLSNPTHLRRLVLLCLAGFLLLALAFPRLYAAAKWHRTVERKKSEIAARWKHSVPPTVFLGDSHVEAANWSQLCQSSLPFENCGLGAGKIKDVRRIAASLAGRPINDVLLLCGINDLGAGRSAAECARQYSQLLQHTRDSLRPKRIFVFSIMPRRASDDWSRNLNQQVAIVNQELKTACQQQNAVFIDTTAAISQGDGGLNPNFTIDGLHLNAEGYRALGQVVCKVLNQ